MAWPMLRTTWVQNPEAASPGLRQLCRQLPVHAVPTTLLQHVQLPIKAQQQQSSLGPSDPA